MTSRKCLAPCTLLLVFLLAGSILAAAQVELSAGAASSHPSSVTTTTIPPQLFGMTAHNEVLYGTPWPTMPVWGMRLWDTTTGWGQINTAKGVYDWSTLDLWTAQAATQGKELIYTFGMTPTWASSGSKDTTCDYITGGCYPPSDLKSDGTGTDQHFIDFVTAIAKHAPSILYWEMWNTPHDIYQWKGTDAQLVRMAKDARTYIKKYIPNAVIISPANGQLNYSYPASNCTMPDKMGGYLAAGLGKYIDVVALHTYYTTVPENIVPVVQCYQSVMATYKISSLPLWSTEGAWGTNAELPDINLEAGFVARLYLLLWSNGVARHYWYAWDDLSTGTLSVNGVPNTAGDAYAQVESWMSGRTMSTLCAENSSGIWTCGLTGANGYAAQAVWHPGGNASYTAPTSYTNYLDLGGVQHNISSGATVTVGEEPILLQGSGTTKPGNFALSEASPFPEVTVGATGTSGPITVTSQNGFAGTVTLSCPATFGSGSCSITPTTVSTFPATATLVINGTSFTAGAYQLAVQGTSGTLTNSVNVAFNVGDYTLTGPAAFSTPSAGTATAGLTLTSLDSYSGKVNATCDASALAGASCALSVANPITVGSTAVPVTATLTIPASAAAGTYNINVTTADVNGTPSHSLTIPVTVAQVQVVQDFTFAAPSPATQTINAGQSATYTFTIQPVGSGFPNAIALTCTGGPTDAPCSLSPSSVTPGTSNVTSVMTISTTARTSASKRNLGKIGLLLFPWMALPGLIVLAGRPRRGKSFVMALVGLLLLALFLTSCGGGAGYAGSSGGSGGSGGGGGGGGQTGTPAGTYTITVTGTAATVTHQATAVTLVVN